MRIKLIGLLLAVSVEAVAQSYTFGLGPSRILDTYLTPEHFSGTGFTFLYIKERQKPESRWSTQWEHEADISSAKDRSKNISMLEGNYDHNIVPTTFISAPTMRQLFTIDWHTGKKWDLRVGYLGNYQQAQVNNLKQHIYTHRVLVGIARGL